MLEWNRPSVAVMRKNNFKATEMPKPMSGSADTLVLYEGVLLASQIDKTNNQKWASDMMFQQLRSVNINEADFEHLELFGSLLPVLNEVKPEDIEVSLKVMINKTRDKTHGTGITEWRIVNAYETLEKVWKRVAATVKEKQFESMASSIKPIVKSYLASLDFKAVERTRTRTYWFFGKLFCNMLRDQVLGSPVGIHQMHGLYEPLNPALSGKCPDSVLVLETGRQCSFTVHSNGPLFKILFSCDVTPQVIIFHMETREYFCLDLAVK